MKKFSKGLLVMLSCLCMNIQAEIISGTCDHYLEWTLDTEKGILTIRRDATNISGVVASMVDMGWNQPWGQYRNDIKEVILEEGITDISWYSIGNLPNVESISLPKSLDDIFTYALAGNTRLKSITIPENVGHVGLHTFDGCDSLKIITILKKEPPVRDGAAIMNYRGIKLCVPEESLEKYKNHPGWGKHKAIRPLDNLIGDNANLDSLELNFDIEPAFNKDITDYYATVESDVDKTFITASAEDSYATAKYNDQFLKDGDNEITVSVIAEDPTIVKKYYIHVYRKSAQTRLKNMTVYGYSLAPAFNQNIEEYSCKVSKNETNIIMTAIPKHDKAKVETSIILPVKDTVLTIKVTAEDERYTKSYTINIETYESSAYLKNLRVEGFELNQEFQKDIYTYNLTVPHNTKEVEIVAVQEDENAIISGDTGWQQITDAKNLFVINIVSEDKMQLRKYNIWVYREMATGIETPTSDEKIEIYGIDGTFLGVTETENGKVIIPNWLGRGVFIAKGIKYMEKFIN